MGREVSRQHGPGCKTRRHRDQAAAPADVTSSGLQVAVLLALGGGGVRLVDGALQPMRQRPGREVGNEVLGGAGQERVSATVFGFSRGGRG